MQVKNATSLTGRVIAPPSKSQSIRAIFFASLAQGKSILLNVLNSTDTQDAIKICRQLGAAIVEEANILFIQGIDKRSNMGIACEDAFFCSGNSGLTTRFLLPLLGLRCNPKQPVVLDCGVQMRARPIASLVDALRQLGLSIEYSGQVGFCPVTVSGTLQGGVAEVQGISSQDISALLLALPCAENDSEIRVENCPSRPYLEMTLDRLKQQKIAYTHKHEGDSDIFAIKGRQGYQKFNPIITGDFSSASSIIAAAAIIPSCVQICGLNIEDPQGDKKLIAILQGMGADIVLESTCITIRGGKVLRGIKIEATDIPDLLPTLAVIGTYATGKTEISHVKQARIKETDRIHSMTLGLRQLGARIEEHEDGMVVYQSRLSGAAVKGWDDHRTVMALAVAGLLAQGVTVISDSEAVNKTFPEFVKVMQSIAADVIVVPQ